MIFWLSAVALLLALVPAVMFLRNLRLYALTPPVENPAQPLRCSILIPARDEEDNIARLLASVVNEDLTDFEVIVLDDGSTDRTAEIVRTLAAWDPRVRLETAPPLPAGWCGKQHACYTLAHLARNPLLVFVDADVRLKPGALPRLVRFMEKSGAALASGVPEQLTETFSERLLLPLIHFVLLGFLPMRRMRLSRKPAFGAGCGQLFVARRDAYLACGGHRAIATEMHDGSKLPRVFRAAGFATDLFDATDLAVCRMYASNRAVWDGLARSAHEGLGAPRLIGPATFLLFGGQVLPFLLLFALPAGFADSPLTVVCVLVAVCAAFLPRLIGVARFHQSLLGAMLHPVGICGLLLIQWCAFFRTRLNRPAHWRGRSYFQVETEKTGARAATATS